MIGKPTVKLKPARAIALMGIIWLTSAVMVWGCGKKGPPEPPSGNRPPRVSDLSYSTDENLIKLSWTIPQTTAKSKTPVAGFVIFRFKQSAHEKECPNCPVIFEQVGDVPIRRSGPGQPALAPLVFTQSLETGYRYIYKMKAYDEDGVVSRDSNFVEFLF